MTHFDESLELTVPTSGFSARTVQVSTDDMPILTGLDRMEFIIFHYSNCFVNEI
jgi:hypothetical protein